MGITGIGMNYYYNSISAYPCNKNRAGQLCPQNQDTAPQEQTGLQTWYGGKRLEEWASEDPKYTDAKTGCSWYVRDGKHPYMIGEDAVKFKKMCQEQGEPWLKKFAEMTGIIQYPDDDSAAYVGTNGTVIISKDGSGRFVDTSSLSYDMIMDLLKNPSIR